MRDDGREDAGPGGAILQSRDDAVERARLHHHISVSGKFESALITDDAPDVQGDNFVWSSLVTSRVIILAD